MGYIIITYDFLCVLYKYYNILYFVNGNYYKLRPCTNVYFLLNISHNYIICTTYKVYGYKS